MNPFKRVLLLSLSTIMLLFMAISCTKEFPRRLAVLTKPIDSLTATARGEVIDMGEAGISEHGFVYDSNASISANAQRVQLGKMNETGSFEATLINLRSNTRYFVNSFLTSISETTYGDPVSFRTAMNLPEVKTESMANITDSTATCNGDVTQDGGAMIFARGVCWSTFSQPTLNNDHSVDGTGTGKFAGSLIHLKKDSTYFVRTYASNNAGTSYGNELSFKAGESQTSPYVTTAEITGIAQTAAVSGGEVVSEGGSPVTSRGVCWSTNPYPAIDDYKTIDDSGPGQFISSVTGVSANTTYYLRAYAINENAIGYGEEKSFTTKSDPVEPKVITAIITDITTTSAISGGTVQDNGGSPVTARGICWSTTQNPTIGNPHTNDGSGTGEFVSSLSGLIPNTLHYVRAYATNSVGTAYGNEVSFTTSSATFYIGQNYGGGIIFYIDNTGIHGLIAAPLDQIIGAQWGCYATLIGTSTGIGTGQANTTAIVNGCSQSNIAARICDNLILNGYSDWFLPSKDELNQMYLQKSVLSAYDAYWSSSEDTDWNAYYQNFYNGNQNANIKDVAYAVRAVRAF